MEPPRIVKKPTNIYAQLGLASMGAFLLFVLTFDGLYFLGLFRASQTPTIFGLTEFLIVTAVTALIIFDFINALKTPVQFEEQRMLSLSLALFFLVYYLYFVGFKMESMWHINYLIFNIAMYFVIVPDILLWLDIITHKTRSDQYFAYLYYLKQTELFKKYLESLNKK